MWLLKSLILGTAFFCVACGNSDLGAEAMLKNKSTSAAASTSSSQSNSLAAQAALSQTVCKAASVYASGDALFGQVMTGLNLCFAPASPAMVTVKVSSYSAGYRYCVVPVKGDVAGAESCFTINGFTTSLALQSGTFDALILVSENNVGYYKSYLAGQSAVMPPLAVAAAVH
jgi:hypothetical protein